MKAATGQDVTAEELGGADVHARRSGVADHYATERRARARDRPLDRPAPAPAQGRRRGTSPSPRSRPPTRPSSTASIPEDHRQPFDPREVIARIVDGSRFHEFKAALRRDARLRLRAHRGLPGRRSSPTTASCSPSRRRRARTSSSSPAQRRIPLVFLQNITGFMVGRSTRRAGSPATAPSWSRRWRAPRCRSSRS